MEYRLLGRSGLKVSVVSVGTVTFGGDGLWGDTDLKGAARQVDMCLDAGINLIDTANVYNMGVSEEITGTLLADGSLSIPSGLAGLAADAAGHVWIAAQPDLLAVAAYRRDSSRPAGSEVFTVTTKDGVPQAFAPVYADGGGQIGAASAVAVMGKRFFLGSALDRNILDCRLP